MIKIYPVEKDWETSTVEQFKFPAGEVGVRVPTNAIEPEQSYFVNAVLKSSDDIMALLMTVDACRRLVPTVPLYLCLSYVPYARQDRVTVDGESLSAVVMANLINSCNFKEVVIADPHSDVITALLNNCTVIEQSDIFKNIYSDWSDKWIVAPDLGANKKAQKFTDKVGAAGVITCTKVRNPKTGKLSNYRCYDDVQGKNCVVLDDILDAGGTFHLVADALEGASSKVLCVTHGIFTKGLNKLDEKFDSIYTTASYYGSKEDVPASLKTGNVIWI